MGRGIVLPYRLQNGSVGVPLVPDEILKHVKHARDSIKTIEVSEMKFQRGGAA